MKMISPIIQRPLYLAVADRIRAMICHSELALGDWIDEVVLCELLGISRTPLREALKQLHSESLVELIPHLGCRVNQLDDESLFELFPVMASLEGLCVSLVTKKLTEDDLEKLEYLHSRLEKFAARQDIDNYYEANREFHGAIQELANNRWLSRVSNELRNILILARHRQLTIPGRLEKSLQEHRNIMEAIRNNDPLAATEAMQNHLFQQQKALMQQSRLNKMETEG